MSTERKRLMDRLTDALGILCLLSIGAVMLIGLWSGVAALLAYAFDTSPSNGAVLASGALVFAAMCYAAWRLSE